MRKLLVPNPLLTALLAAAPAGLGIAPVARPPRHWTAGAPPANGRREVARRLRQAQRKAAR